jgi:signal transduction histidine kinase
VLVDRLAIRLVRNISRLAVAARAFGGGDLTRRVDPSGPRELVDAAMSFNIMAEQIVGLLAAERELAADLSHRLRTPLTALRLDAQRLGADHYAERVKHAATLLEYELDEMITAARRPLHDRKPVPADLTELVSERAQFWAPLAEDERRRWGIRIPSHVVPVAVPREDLVAAVDVLLGNIFRHTDPGTPYAIRLDVAGPAAALVVEDAGRGFDNSPDALRRGSSTGSTGLGLDIARRVAESTGGSIRLERSRLGGALVELRFALAFPVTT